MHILNKRAHFEYEISEIFEFGIILLSSEVKAIRDGSVSIQEAYLNYKFPHVWIYNMFIGKYKNLEHDTKRDRIILLKEKDKNKIISKIKLKGLALIPIELFFNEKGFVKLKCGLGIGKKLFDKRRSIKEREVKRNSQRFLK